MGGTVALRVRAIACALALLAACSDSSGGSGDDDASGSGGASGNTGASGAGGMHGGASGMNAGGGGRSSGSGGHATSGSGGAHAGSGGNAASGSGGHASGSGGAGQQSHGALPQIGGCDVFTADDAWNRDISAEDADPDWTDKLHALVGDANIHPDYGNSGDEHYGIPINVVPESQAPGRRRVRRLSGGERSGAVSVPRSEQREDRRRHARRVRRRLPLPRRAERRRACCTRATPAATTEAAGTAANGAKWDLKKNSYGQRPKGWTSADAAGLAITPGLVRYDEVKTRRDQPRDPLHGECTRDNFVAPASHRAVPGGCDANDPNAPPMGLRVRLKSDYDISQPHPNRRKSSRARCRPTG